MVGMIILTIFMIYDLIMLLPIEKLLAEYKKARLAVIANKIYKGE